MSKSGTGPDLLFYTLLTSRHNPQYLGHVTNLDLTILVGIAREAYHSYVNALDAGDATGDGD